MKVHSVPQNLTAYFVLHKVIQGDLGDSIGYQTGVSGSRNELQITTSR